MVNIGESYTLREPSGFYKETLLYEPVLSHVRSKFDTFQALRDDVVLVSYYKCGGTWLKSLAYSILHYKDDVDPLVDAPVMHEAVPSIEDTRPASAAGPAFDGLASASAQTCSPRLYHTSMPYRALPRDVLAKGCRIVYVARNPKDMLVSMASFMKACSEREVYWAVRSDADTPLAAIAERTAEDFLQGREMYGPFMRHAPEMWEAIREDEWRAATNSLLMHYEEMLNDYEAQVRRLAAFLEAPLDDRQIARVCQRTVFGALKATESGKSRVNTIGVGPNVFFAKGKANRWRDALSEETAERVDRFCQEALAGSDFRFAA